jgi:predicted permease
LLSAFCGAAAAAGAVRILRDAMPSFVTESLPNWRAMHVDLRALIVSIAVATVTGVMIALWPIVRVARTDVVVELKEGARSATSSGDASHGRRGLVVVEIALAIVLLAAAGLLSRSVRNLYAVDPGFRGDHLLTLRITSPPRVPGDTTPVDSMRYEHLAERLEAIPGVASASPAFGLPYGHAASTNGFRIEGRPSDSPLRGAAVQMVPAGTKYFQTLDLPILRGRPFAATDRSGWPRVAIIDEALAKRFFANDEPLGQRVIIDSVPWRIVGVARAVRRDARGHVISQVPGVLYRPIAQWYWRSPEFVLRTRGDPLDVVAAAIRAVRAFDPNVAVTRVASMATLMEQDVAPDRVLAVMIAVFAAAATLISAIGLYGVVSYSVAQRSREFGIRRALGAESGSVLTLVLGQGARLAAAGAAIGLVGALLAGRLLRALLFGVSPADPLTLAIVATGMCVIALLAAYGPARRAVRIDPMLALRDE